MRCHRLKLFTEALVTMDGSKFKAVNNPDKNFTDRKLKARIEQLEGNVQHYLAEPDRADRQPESVPQERVARLKEKISSLKEQAKKFNKINKRLQQELDKQRALPDQDARSMTTSGTGIVGYNMQPVADTQNHLIVAHALTNVGHDRAQLSPWPYKHVMPLNQRFLR